MKYLLTLIPYPVTYLLAAFVNWNLDAGCWPEAARAVVAFGASIVAALVWQVLLESKNYAS
jgi:hypothetical protein